MPTIDFKEILRTGALGDIHVGIARSEVEKYLGPAEDRLSGGGANHLFYGCLQFQCDDEWKVEGIYIHTDSRFPRITSTLAFEPAGIVARMEPEAFARQVKACGIECENGRASPGFLKLCTGSKSAAFFEKVDEHEQLLFVMLSDGCDSTMHPRESDCE